MTLYPAVKRGLDAAGALLLLIPLSVLFLPVIVVLALTGEHQVFYRQQRIGRGGREFGILKFATMLRDSPSLAGGSLTVRGDPRVLPFGRFLRATKINELPQVVNVPRRRYVVRRPATPGPRRLRPLHGRGQGGGHGSPARDHRNRLRRLPRRGAVPLASRDRSGAFYGERIAPYKGALEAWYSAHGGPRTDLLILWATAWTVLRPASEIVFRVFPDLPPRPEWWSEPSN